MHSRIPANFAISLLSNLHHTGHMQHVQAWQDVPFRQVLLVCSRHQRAQALPLRARFQQDVSLMSARTHLAISVELPLELPAPLVLLAALLRAAAAPAIRR